jgi:hypothetical protein
MNTKTPTIEQFDIACQRFTNEEHLSAGDAHGVVHDCLKRAADALRTAHRVLPGAARSANNLEKLAARHGMLRRMHYVLGGFEVYR